MELTAKGEFTEGNALDIVSRLKGEVDELVVRKVLMEVVRTFQANDDHYYCIVCLTDLGRDCPEGWSCGKCTKFYCEDCYKDLNNCCPGCKQPFDLEIIYHCISCERPITGDCSCCGNPLDLCDDCQPSE